jgi:hypothetical protein
MTGQPVITCHAIYGDVAIFEGAGPFGSPIAARRNDSRELPPTPYVCAYFYSEGEGLLVNGRCRAKLIYGHG